MVLTAGALAMKMPHGMPSSNCAINILCSVSNHPNTFPRW